MNIQTIKVTSVDKVQPIKITNAQNIVLNFDLQEKEVIPTKEEQIIKADLGYDGLKQVEIKPIPSEYIKPTGTKAIIENGIHNVKEFENVDVNVIYQTNYQEKNIVPTKEIQEIVADENYDALEKVVVEPIPNDYVIPNGKLEITENGEYNVSNYELVKVETSGADINEYFTETITNYSISTSGAWANVIKKLPKFIVTGRASLANLYQNFKGTKIDVSGVDTTATTNMSSMFTGCQYVTGLDLSTFDTSNVTNMSGMFYQCQNLYTLDLSNWNTSKVTNMTNMFYQCRQLMKLDLRHFDTSQITSTYDMFYECRALTELDISNFNTTNTTNMSFMFAYCYALPKLDLSHFDTSQVRDMSGMFRDCNNLLHLDIRNFDFTNVTTYSNMFRNVPTDCEIIVKDETAKNWVLNVQSSLKNVKTVAEKEAE